jgi:hypothetical protein
MLVESQGVDRFKLQSLEAKHHPHLSSERTKGVVVQREHDVVPNDATEVPALPRRKGAEAYSSNTVPASLALALDVTTQALDEHEEFAPRSWLVAMVGWLSRSRKTTGPALAGSQLATVG